MSFSAAGVSRHGGGFDYLGTQLVFKSLSCGSSAEPTLYRPFGMKDASGLKCCATAFCLGRFSRLGFGAKAINVGR